MDGYGFNSLFKGIKRIVIGAGIVLVVAVGSCSIMYLHSSSKSGTVPSTMDEVMQRETERAVIFRFRWENCKAACSPGGFSGYDSSKDACYCREPDRGFMVPPEGT